MVALAELRGIQVLLDRSKRTRGDPPASVLVLEPNPALSWR